MYKQHWRLRGARPHKPKNPLVPKHYREMVVSLLLQRDGNLCGICQQPLGDSIEIDHVKPRARGGKHEANNIRLTHAKCNYEKGPRK